MKKAYFIIFSILIVGLIAIFTTSGLKNESFRNFINGFQTNENTDSINEEGSSAIEQNTNALSEEDSSQNGAESDTEETEEDPECVERKVSYSLANLEIKEICNQLIDNICTNKTAHCTLEVNNFNYEIEGTFSIEFEFKTKEESIDRKIVSDTIAPRSFKILESEINIQSEGEDGNANKEIKCAFLSKEIPVENTC